MSKIRVGVLRGGPSSEYDVSLKTGGHVLRQLFPKYQTHDILITKDGLWHLAGVPKDPGSVLRHVDVVFNALHGGYGEDGKVQQLLESHDVPYTGSRAFSSAMAMNKELTKKWFKKEGIKTPLYTIVDKSENILERAVHIFKTFPQPSVIKPVSSGSSLGVSVAHTISEITSALREALSHADKALVEEYIQGREATCGVIEDFRGEKAYALLPVEIMRRPQAKIHDFLSKYGGEAQSFAPGNFTFEESSLIQKLAVKAHQAFGLRHYSRSDFIIHPRRGVYILETNTLPGLTENCPFPQSLHAVGTSFPDFLDHLIALALQEK